MKPADDDPTVASGSTGAGIVLLVDEVGVRAEAAVTG
jgi:hypothetical protein